MARDTGVLAARIERLKELQAQRIERTEKTMADMYDVIAERQREIDNLSAALEAAKESRGLRAV